MHIPAGKSFQMPASQGVATEYFLAPETASNQIIARFAVRKKSKRAVVGSEDIWPR